MLLAPQWVLYVSLRLLWSKVHNLTLSLLSFCRCCSLSCLLMRLPWYKRTRSISAMPWGLRPSCGH